MRRFEYAPRADADLVAIYEHIATQDPSTAVLVIDRIEETVDQLCIFPRMGKPTAKPEIWVFDGSRKSSFRITYRFDDEMVTVVRIFRASRQTIQI